MTGLPAEGWPDVKAPGGLIRHAYPRSSRLRRPGGIALVGLVALLLSAGAIVITPRAEAGPFGPNPPLGVHLSYAGDPATTVITWHTSLDSTSRAEWGVSPGPPFSGAATGTDYTSPGGTFLHTVTLTGLVPDTRYYYRVGDAAMISGFDGGSFRTARSVGAAEFTFAAAGDWGTSGAASSTANGIAARTPDLVLGLGDYYYAASDAGVRAFYEQVQPFAQGSFFPMAMGNHENGLPSESAYTPKETHCAFVNLPGNERSFAFKYANTFFLTMDWGRFESDMNDGVDGSGPSCQGSAGTAAIRAWTDAQLAAADLDPDVWWKVVFEHFLCYDTTTSPQDWVCPGKGQPDQMEDIMVNRGVDLVLQSHMHNYGRTHPVRYNAATQRAPTYDTPGAPIYVVLGTGGESPSLYPCRADDWVAACRGATPTQGFGHFSVTPTTIVYEFVENNGVDVDSFTLSKGSDATTVSFQKGDGGAYSETDDAFLFAGAPNTNYGSTDTLRVDGSGCVDLDEQPSNVCRGLLQFPNLLGPNQGQVPSGATILRSILQISVTSPGMAHHAYQVTEPWTEGAATWNGFAVPGFPGNNGPAFSFNPSRIGRIGLDVRSIVRGWADGDANRGLLFASFDPDGAWYASSESALAPKLWVTWEPPSESFDFSVSVSPTSGTVSAGDAVTASVTASLLSGDADEVSFSAMGLPEGASASYAPSHCFPTCTTTLTITTTTGTPEGTYGVSIVGSNGTIDHGASFTLVVEPPADVTLSFQKGDGGAYSETDDAFIASAFPVLNYGGESLLRVDRDGCLTDLPLIEEICRSLIRFPSFIGSNAGQVPSGATVLSASLEVWVADRGGQQTAYQLAESWSEFSVTWLTFFPPGEPDTTGGGYNFGVPTEGLTTLDVKGFVQNWVDGETNLGWLLTSWSSDGVRYRSSESANPPKLTVTFQPPSGQGFAPPRDSHAHSTPRGESSGDNVRDDRAALVGMAVGGFVAVLLPAVRARPRPRGWLGRRSDVADAAART